MTEKKETKQNGKKARPSSKKTNRQKAKQTGQQNSKSAAKETVENLLGKSDQLGIIVTKGFDLAEAGITLALNIVNRMGTIAPESFIEKITSPFMGTDRQGGQAQDNNTNSGNYEDSQNSKARTPESGLTFITNRMPIFPGQEVKVSFSINNDSFASEKKVKLNPEGFIGENSSVKFDGKLFSVQPAKATIQVMDFEKFTLVGTLPANLPPDVYHGRIVVNSESEIKIEVRLNVSASM